jgi:PKHD-type hydroxylase
VTGSGRRPPVRVVARPQLPDPPGLPYRPFQIHPAAFTARQCDRIVALGLSLGADDATLASDHEAGVRDDDIRRSRTAWIAATDDTWWIFDKLATLVERANRSYGFELTGFGEDLQFTTYEAPGDFYSWHQDGLDGDLAARKLSVVVQLSDPADYSGGEIQLFEVAEDYDLEELDAFSELSSRRGSAVVFPAFEYHRVLPVRSGTRHSLVAWVSGPPFR